LFVLIGKFKLAIEGNFGRTWILARIVGKM